MNSDLMVFSDRIHFLKRWILLLISGIVIGGLAGFLLKNFASKTVYTYNLGIEVYHPFTKKMSHKEYQRLKLSDTQNAQQYMALVKSASILGVVNEDLHANHGVIINNVDLAQMYGSGQYYGKRAFLIYCTSSSKDFAKLGLNSMAKIVKLNISKADTAIKMKSLNVSHTKVPQVQKGNNNVLFYSPLTGLFIAAILAVYLDTNEIWKGKKNAFKK